APGRRGHGPPAVPGSLACLMGDKQPVRLGAVQATLFITLAARARETERKHPVLRDPKAAELLRSIDYDAATYGRGAGGFLTVLRTAIIDFWVREFLAAHPAATVVELGTGLNTRFERVDNGQVHWFDLDLPDTIELRRNFFADTGRRRMVAASVLDEDWLPAVAQSQGPYFFVAEGVLVYLPEEQVMAALARIAARFPGALIALDTYPQKTFDQQHKLAARKGIDARWAWSCDDPRALERFGLEVRQSATITRPPRAMRAQLPFRYRYLVPLADPVLGKAMTLTLFRASSQAAVGRAATAREAGSA
ncbi:MAG TPA: class I SAM-dependent methyltransferase, partial [Streptosporangiaceae bacterium]|nr:class I SAM-dependent methyltransferase [Streptosporangiaceae bacterium]